MAIKDIFLPLTSYPSLSVQAINKCVVLVRHLGAHVSALAVDVDVPASSRPFVRPICFTQEMAEEAPARSGAREALETFYAMAGATGASCESMIVRSTIDEIPMMLANHARLCDMSLVPVKSHDSAMEKILTALVFSSGRPILILPADRADTLSDRFDHVTIAWDHSPQAARAVGDALPLFRAAKTVRILTVADHVNGMEARSGAALVKHLSRHGIAATFEIVPLGGSSVGKVFEAEVKANGTDLLVMGAYGHSWLKEFTWGGATNTVLSDPPCWVLMSH